MDARIDRDPFLGRCAACGNLAIHQAMREHHGQLHCRECWDIIQDYADTPVMALPVVVDYVIDNGLIVRIAE
jgi:hypothetical protein